MIKSKRGDMPSRSKIKEYWFPLHFSSFGETRTGDDELVDDECWACGNSIYIERCHIHSLSEGGTNNADNLVLLCRGCHHESELLSPDFFWNWIRGKRKTDWMSQIERAQKKIELVFGGTDNLVKRINDVGAEKAINEVFSAFGFHQTNKDMSLLYKQIDKNMKLTNAKKRRSK
jgi:HNH endonuclease